MLTFYEINDDGTTGAPALYIDTAKVSTIEQTADDTSAMGGKGNAKLITWDFNKEITVTIEDALFSAKSMAIMFGNGKVKTDLTQLKRTISWVATSAADNGKPTKFSGPQGKEYTIPTAKATTYDGTGTSVTSSYPLGHHSG